MIEAAWQKLRAVDERLLNRRPDCYDRPVPGWVRYAGVISGPVIAVSFLVWFGAWWWRVVAIPIWVGWVTYVVLVIRWERLHRKQNRSMPDARSS